MCFEFQAQIHSCKPNPDIHEEERVGFFDITKPQLLPVFIYPPQRNKS